MEEAYARAEAADAQAKQALNRSKTDAQRARQAQVNRNNELYFTNNRGRTNQVDATGVGLDVDDPTAMGDVATIGGTASYSDYLAAKSNASKAWAALQRQSSSPYEQGLRDSLGGKDQAKKAFTAGNELDARDAAATGADATAAAGTRGAALSAQEAWAAQQRGVRQGQQSDANARRTMLGQMGDPRFWSQDDQGKYDGQNGNTYWQDMAQRGQLYSRVNASLGGDPNSAGAKQASWYALDRTPTNDMFGRDIGLPEYDRDGNVGGPKATAYSNSVYGKK